MVSKIIQQQRLEHIKVVGVIPLNGDRRGKRKENVAAEARTLNMSGVCTPFIDLFLHQVITLC